MNHAVSMYGSGGDMSQGGFSLVEVMIGLAIA
ncbi:MAG: hypothetical protein C0616_08800 [Desulfuromonas sp.]|nr:MAG: hypothetical protein C0616_08800 [Desulfuromonas sp.]